MVGRAGDKMSVQVNLGGTEIWHANADCVIKSRLSSPRVKPPRKRNTLSSPISPCLERTTLVGIGRLQEFGSHVA